MLRAGRVEDERAKYAMPPNSRCENFRLSLVPFGGLALFAD